LPGEGKASPARGEARGGEVGRAERKRGLTAAGEEEEQRNKGPGSQGGLPELQGGMEYDEEFILIKMV